MSNTYTFSEKQKQLINDYLQDSIDFIQWCKRVSVVGNSLNQPSCRFEKARANDMSLDVVSNGVIKYVDEEGYDFEVDLSPLLAIDPTLPSVIYASGKGVGKPVYQRTTGMTEKIMLKNSQSSTDTPNDQQLEKLMEVINVALIYGTGDHKSIDIVYAQDLQSSHIATASTSRLEIKLPVGTCTRLFESTRKYKLNCDLRKVIDQAVATEITKQCAQLDTKDQNENYSTPSGSLPMSVEPVLPSMALVEQASSVQPCVSTV